MKIDAWFAIANNSCQLLEDYTAKAFQRDISVNELIRQISARISEQWLSTHNIGIKQVEEGREIQGNLLASQYDVNNFKDILRFINRFCVRIG